MEIRHTVEILTKDIQDIEKLVRNLNNYAQPPQIEIDLAMSKLRNVYDLLSMISQDIKNDHPAAAGTPHDHPAAEVPAPGQQQETPGTTDAPVDQLQSVTPTKDVQPGQESTERIQTTEQEEPDQSAQPAQQAQGPQDEQNATGKETAQKQQAPQQEQTSQQQQEPRQEQTSGQQQTSQQQQAPQQEQAPGQQQASEQKQSRENEQPKKEAAGKASILAEKFASDKSLNEKIAPGPGDDLSSKLTGEPIESIKRHIGINDRFLIIRELMDGNNDAFNTLVQQLDTQHNFDEAYTIIQSEFPGQMEHEGVNLLVRLSRRRYLSK